jgi:hypothetical protein
MFADVVCSQQAKFSIWIGSFNVVDKTPVGSTRSRRPDHEGSHSISEDKGHERMTR